MLKIVFLVLCLIFVSRGCRVIEERANGVTSKREDSSYLVLLEAYIVYEKKNLCTGSLISPNFVLTSAYCIFGTSFVNVHVYANKLRDEFEDKRSIYRVSSANFILAPQFDHLHHLNDIGLIKMPDSFTPKTYITYPQLPANPLVAETEINTYGWGLLDWKDDHAASYKQELPLKVLNVAECAEAYPNISWTTEYQGRFCGKAISGKNCVSDNGSPFIVNNVVFGIQSAGQLEACDGNQPNLIQDVSHHADWIRAQLEL
ncbi:brachyurin-like [Chironomus tepperi]|uniref:brachyurin-like n=1 Tax=Chironomus tepperi TaxID=113505 RepID=UPI00391FAAF1